MFSKYLDYYEPATNAQKGAQLECQQKDVVIGQLKGQLHELRQLQGDYYRLNELIQGLEGKYSLLIAEKDRSEKQQKVKSDIDKKTIIDLRADIDDLRVQLQKTNLVIEELIRSNANIKRQVQTRTNEIQSFRYQIKQLQNKNQRSNDENRCLALNLKALKEERKQIQDECEQLSAILDEQMARLKNTEKEVRASESSNARLEKTLYQAEKDNSKLVAELKEKNEDTKKAENKFKGVNNSIADLAISYKNLQQQTNKNKGELQKNNAILGREIEKGKDIQNKIASVEANIRNQENQLDLLITEEENLRKQHFSALDHNKNLNLEIDKVLALIAEYEQVNRELLDEIEYFIEQDHQARSMLDRAEVMREIIEGSVRKISLTEQAIKHLKC